MKTWSKMNQNRKQSLINFSLSNMRIEINSQPIRAVCCQQGWTVQHNKLPDGGCFAQKFFPWFANQATGRSGVGPDWMRDNIRPSFQRRRHCGSARVEPWKSLCSRCQYTTVRLNVFFGTPCLKFSIVLYPYISTVCTHLMPYYSFSILCTN